MQGKGPQSSGKRLLAMGWGILGSCIPGVWARRRGMRPLWAHPLSPTKSLSTEEREAEGGESRAFQSVGSRVGFDYPGLG